MQPAPPPPTRPMPRIASSTVASSAPGDEETHLHANDASPLPTSDGGNSLTLYSTRAKKSASLRVISQNPAWKVIKHVKRMSSTKLTHLVLRIIQDKKILSLDRVAQDAGHEDSKDAGAADSTGMNKYPRVLEIMRLSTVVRASNLNILTFKSSTTEKALTLEFQDRENCDICCRLLYSANKSIQFCDEGEKWLKPGVIVEYMATAGKRHGSVTGRVGAAFTSSRVVLRLNLLKRQLMLIWPSKRKRYNVPSVMSVKDNWTVQCDFIGAPTKAKLLVPSLDHSCGIIVMEFFFRSPAVKLRFCGHIRVAMLQNVGIEQLRRTGLALSGIRGPQLKIWCGTWNCGETPSPGIEELSKWIDVENAHDVYAIAFQECDDKNSFVNDCKAVFVGKSRHAMDDIAFVSLWGIHLLVLIRRSISRFVTNVRTDSVACGVANLLGNKGAVGCAFHYNGSTEFAFIGSHLAARAKRMEERRRDFMNIVTGMKALLAYKGTDFLHQTRHCFWLGDLNYRINILNGPGHDTQGEFEEVLRMIKNKNFDLLQQHDQLIREKDSNKNAFQDFVEGKLNFPPTYRMNKGAPGYSNKRFQAPSYTDRILVRSVTGYESKVRQNSYKAHHDLMQSDHRPVSAAYTVETNLPFMNIVSNTSVVNRETCDILFSNLSVEVQSLDSLQKAIESISHAKTEENNPPRSSDSSFTNPLHGSGNSTPAKTSIDSNGDSHLQSWSPVNDEETASDIVHISPVRIDTKEKKKSKKKGLRSVSSMMTKIVGKTVRMTKKLTASVQKDNGFLNQSSEDKVDARPKSGEGLIEVALRFTSNANFLSEGVSSEVIYTPDGLHTNQLSVAWQDEQIPAIVPLNGDFLYVRSQHIIITVRIRRAADAMFHRAGYAEIPLTATKSDLFRIQSDDESSSVKKSAKKFSRGSYTSGAMRSKSHGGAGQHFNAPLFLHGVQVGNIRGSVRLRNVIQPPSSSLAKRWRRRSDMAFSSHLKREMSKLSRQASVNGLTITEETPDRAINAEESATALPKTASGGVFLSWGVSTDNVDAWLDGGVKYKESEAGKIGAKLSNSHSTRKKAMSMMPAASPAKVGLPENSK